MASDANLNAHKTNQNDLTSITSELASWSSLLLNKFTALNTIVGTAAEQLKSGNPKHFPQLRRARQWLLKITKYRLIAW